MKTEKEQHYCEVLLMKRLTDTENDKKEDTPRVM